MTRTSPDLILTEVPGSLYPTLAAAQQAALKATAHDIAATLRALLAAGVLVQVNGKIVSQSDRNR
jgi:hypothetical protein